MSEVTQQDRDARTAIWRVLADALNNGPFNVEANDQKVVEILATHREEAARNARRELLARAMGEIERRRVTETETDAWDRGWNSALGSAVDAIEVLIGDDR